MTTECYAAPLPELTGEVAELEAKVSRHLERMGFKPKKQYVGISDILPKEGKKP